MARPKQQGEDSIQLTTITQQKRYHKYCIVLSKHSDAFLVLARPRPSTTPANVLSFVSSVYRSDNGCDQHLRQSNSRRGNNGYVLSFFVLLLAFSSSPRRILLIWPRVRPPEETTHSFRNFSSVLPWYEHPISGTRCLSNGIAPCQVDVDMPIKVILL